MEPADIMTAQSCIICFKAITRSKKAVSCCVCSKLTHAECGEIDDALLNRIVNGAIEWKCKVCRNKSTRRSIVNTGSSTLKQHKSSNSNPTLQLNRSSSVISSQSTDMQPTLAELNKNISSLHRGFDVACKAIDDMRQEMANLQSISSTLTEHSTRITKNEDKIASLEYDVKTLTRRLDELETSSKPPSIQINGIPDNVQLPVSDIVNRIGNFIGVQLAPEVLTTAKRLNMSRKVPDLGLRSDVAGNGSSGGSVMGVNAIPIIVRFVNETHRRDFLQAFRRKGPFHTSDIALHNEMDKSKIFIFEYLTAAVRKVYLNAKKFQKANQYKFLWTRDGKIFLRRTDDSLIIRVMPHTDLTKIGSNNGSSSSRNGRSGGAGGGASETI